MNKIQRVSLFFRAMFQVLFIALPVMLVLAWTLADGTIVMFGGASSISFIPSNYTQQVLHEMSALDKFLGFCVNLLPMMIDLYIVYTLIRLFKLYEQGIIFSLKNVYYIRNIGYALFFTQIINPIYESLMGLVLTAHNPPGHRFMSVSFGNSNIEIILIALIIILISWIMAEGCRLHEEQALTI